MWCSVVPWHATCMWSVEVCRVEVIGVCRKGWLKFMIASDCQNRTELSYNLTIMWFLAWIYWYLTLSSLTHYLKHCAPHSHPNTAVVDTSPFFVSHVSTANESSGVQYYSHIETLCSKPHSWVWLSWFGYGWHAWVWLWLHQKVWRRHWVLSRYTIQPLLCVCKGHE